MSFSQPTRTELFGVAFAVALTLVACQSWANSSPPSWTSPLPEAASDSEPVTAVSVPDAPPGDQLDAARRGRVGLADGEIPDGTTIFDDHFPAVSNLDDDLRDALRSASDDSGIAFEISSGWRSDRYQRQVFEQAVAKYGSEDEAARWAARPGTSIHEAGEAVDVSDSEGADWLARHGDSYGLCQIYANEPWHYEMRSDADDDGCPAMFADAAHDPRMR
jgi:D-alanyl-D-alanine carboxypeptidase